MVPDAGVAADAVMKAVMTMKDSARRAPQTAEGARLLVFTANELAEFLRAGAVSVVRDVVAQPPSYMEADRWLGAEPWLPPAKRTPRRYVWTTAGTRWPPGQWYEAVCPFGAPGDVFTAAGRTVGMASNYCAGSDSRVYRWQAVGGWQRVMPSAADGMVAVNNGAARLRFSMATLMAAVFAGAGGSRIAVRSANVGITAPAADRGWQWHADVWKTGVKAASADDNSAVAVDPSGEGR
jgi:hypothetical protein